MNNTVNIPAFLHEFHGRKSNWLDLAATHLIALVATATALILSDQYDLTLWKKFLFAALAYDLGGGVMSNFTYATNLYYDHPIRKRLIFITLHWLQPVLMSLVFPAYWQGILLFSAYILASTFIVNGIQIHQRQLTLGIGLTLLGLLALFFVSFIPPVSLLLTLFLLKLPLAFAVRWYRFPKWQAQPLTYHPSAQSEHDRTE